MAIAVVALVSELGYPVASLIAGLGIGGLALALAAQKNVENLLGAFSIGADQPFREGDFVRVEDFVGTVEAIGLRSIRIRTLDRTLISIPWRGSRHDWREFQLMRQDVLLDFMAVVESAGSSFAFPTQTVHVVADKSSAHGPHVD